jgi:hypothetical protein
MTYDAIERELRLELTEAHTEVERLKDARKMLLLCEGDRKEMAAEIERLQDEAHYAKGTCDLAMKHRDEAEAEVERLKAEAVLWEDRYNHRAEGDGLEIERLKTEAKEAEADWQLMVHAWKDKADRRADEIARLNLRVKFLEDELKCPSKP